MKLCLAGTGILKNHPEELKKSRYLLESFYSVQEWQIPFFEACDFFLLDSGAFTFMNSQKGPVDFDAYLQRYADFVKRHHIEHFFELDIDPIVGYDRVKEMRRTLERETGARCIPVWHKSRGLEDFKRTAQEYDYMAIGGIVTKEIPPSQWQHLEKLISIAHVYGCKIHGLGFTSSAHLSKYHFDSVDSTTWNVGGKYGNVCKIKDGRVTQVHFDDKRVADRDGLMLHNFRTWCKFQAYVDMHY